MKKQFVQLVTGRDNTTHDLIRWCSLVATAEALVLVGYDVLVRGAHFDLQQFGIGCGALFAATGAGLAMKSKTEPGAPDGSTQ